MTNFIFENTWEENQEALKTKKLAIIPVGSSGSTFLHLQLAQTG